MQPLDLAFVVNDFNFFLTHREKLLLSFLDKKHKVTLITDTSGSEERVLKKYKDLGLEIIPFSIDRSSMNPFKNLEQMFVLFLILKEVKPKILTLISSKPIIYGGLLSKVLKLDKIFFVISGLGYSFISNELRARFARFIIFFLYKFIFKHKRSKVIFQNNDDKDLFTNSGLLKNEQSILIRGNGVSTKQFCRSAYPEKLTFLFASRLLIDKGINEFLVAANNCRDLDIQFIVAGEIDTENPNCINEEDFKSALSFDFINYVGKINYEEMNHLFNKAHVFVLPSYREGLPKVALEAGLCSMPLILTDTIGCRDCLVDSETGYLVKMKSSEDIEKKVRSFYHNREKIEEMGIKSREYIQNNFSESIICKQYIDLYEGGAT